jgi:hypothetical protein
MEVEVAEAAAGVGETTATVGEGRARVGVAVGSWGIADSMAGVGDGRKTGVGVGLPKSDVVQASDESTKATAA